jgi:hypothetical protein
MPTYVIAVTDVTRYGDKFCIAGWELDRSKMIRPQPFGAQAGSEPSKFWPSNQAGEGQALAVGNVVRFDAAKPDPTFGFPHATEDRVLLQGGTIEVLKQVGTDALAKAVRDSVSQSLAGAFGGGLERKANGKAYVKPGFKGPSLGAIEVKSDAIHLHEHTDWNGRTKLRAWVNDGAQNYDLSVPAESIGNRWREVGIEKLKEEVVACDLIHVRVGLARAFPDNPCYAQANGFIFL